MRRFAVVLILFVFSFFSIAASGLADDTSGTDSSGGQGVSSPMVSRINQDYAIGAGDILDISVWKNEELTKQVPVLPDGKISFPLIGVILAEGKTVEQLKKEVEEKLTRYIPNPTLSVVVRQVNSLLIYVIGKVNNPGVFPLNTNVNVLQALSMARGMNPFAKRNNIRIFREQGDTTKIFDFQYDKVSEGSYLEQNIQLRRGDIIVVP